MGSALSDMLSRCKEQVWDATVVVTSNRNVYLDVGSAVLDIRPPRHYDLVAEFVVLGIHSAGFDIRSARHQGLCAGYMYLDVGSAVFDILLLVGPWPLRKSQ